MSGKQGRGPCSPRLKSGSSIERLSTCVDRGEETPPCSVFRPRRRTSAPAKTRISIRGTEARHFFLLLVLASLLLPSPARADDSVWLSSLDLSVATQGWGKPGADVSAGGNPLTLAGHVYAHGFGTHSPGILAVDLGGGAKRLTASVGIDDEVGAGKGSAEFIVRGAAGAILWRSGVRHQGQTPLALDVDLTGQARIILQVTEGGDGFDFDHADWADVRLITSFKPKTVPWKPEGGETVIAMTPAGDAPQIHPPFVVGFRPGTPLLWAVPVSGARPLKFSAAGLPRGLTLDPAMGIVTGRTAGPGDWAVRITAVNSAGRTSQTAHVVCGDTLALTPPMGWNSYDAYGDSAGEAEVWDNARYVARAMQPYGWDTVVVDYRWYDPGAHDNNPNGRAGAALAMDGNGRLLPAPNRFPSAADGRGFRALADRVHALGLRFGIHIMRGIPRLAVTANLPIEGSPYKCAEAADVKDTCPWCPDMFGVRGATPAGRAYYDSLMRLCASWGIDFIKMDDTSAPYHTDEIEAVHQAIEKCGRSIVYSLSPGETPIEQAAHVAARANQWRVSGDFWDGWGALDHEFTLAQRWQGWAAPGHWPDADMLPVGHLSVGGRSVGPDRRTGFSHAEQVTLMSFWALLPAPLMAGAALTDNDDWTRALLTNPEVLAVDQDAAGRAATLAQSRDEAQVWVRTLADGSRAVGLFNRGDFAEPVTADWGGLGLSGRWAVRDLWQRRDLGVSAGTVTASVPPHGAVFLRLTRVAR